MYDAVFAMHGKRFCMRWIIRGWPGTSADGLSPRLAPNICEVPAENGYLKRRVTGLVSQMTTMNVQLQGMAAKMVHLAY